MTDVAALKIDMDRLHNQISGQYQLLREISSILGAVTSTLSSANQINAHERELLIARLEGISTSISSAHRELGGMLERLERAIEGAIRDRETSDEAIAEILKLAETFADQVKAIHPSASETLRHTRKLVNRDPDSGAEMSIADKLLNAFVKDFWTAIRIAALLWGMSSLLPWVRGIRIP